MSNDPSSSYQAIDPIVSSNFSALSLSVSRVRQSPSRPNMPTATMTAAGSESAPLLSGPRSGKTKKPFYRPRPLCPSEHQSTAAGKKLVPFGIVASVVRGMTLAPRVQVFTQLSCNAVYGHDVYDHTSDGLNATAPALPHSYHIPLYTSLDPAGPHLDTQFMSTSDLLPPSENSGRIYITQSGAFHSSTESDDDNNEPDPRAEPSKRCLADSTVLAGAARLQTIMTTTMGTLSALTTGWWGHFGEQHGRTRVLAASTLGLLLTDLTFILVSTPHSAFAAHGHKLLIISPIIEGLLGGWSTLQAATSAYISDCTSDGSRAQIFSRFTGVFYLGFSLGPVIGAYLIRHPLLSFPGTPSSSSGHNSSVHNGQPTVTSVFYVAAMCSFVNLLLVLFVFPESLDKKKSKSGIQAEIHSTVSTLEAETPAKSLVAIAPDAGGVVVGAGSWLRSFLGSLALFMPKTIVTPHGGVKRDWSLTILGLSLFMFLLASGIFQIKYLYAGHVYQWGAEQLSYYITFVGGVRAVHLLFVMPHLISSFKPKPKPKSSQSVSVPASDHVDSASRAVSTAQTQPTKPKPTLAHLAKEMNFDLMLLRFSFFIECLSHTLVSLAPTTSGPGVFVGFTTLSCFGAGVIPAANSLALCIMQMQRQASGSTSTMDDQGGAGKLFGALASLQAVGQMILGPLLFGIVFSSTVGTFPKAIFATAAGITVTALALLCLLRPDVSLRLKQQQQRTRQEQLERGRSRISKDLTRSSAGSSPNDADVPLAR